MKIEQPIVIDFETKGIQRRPEYPPLRLAFSIKWPKMKKAVYHAWGTLQQQLRFAQRKESYP